MKSEEELVRKEASISVQARVDVRVLAEMVQFWQRKGHQIRTMSQLVSWSMEMMYDVLKMNGEIEGDLLPIMEARQVLQKAALWQFSLSKRNDAKLHRAASYESLRTQGYDPRDYDRTGNYERLHNRRDTYSSNDSVREVEKDMRVNSTQETLAIHEMEERKKRGDLKEDYVPGQNSGSILTDYQLFKAGWALLDQERKEKERKAKVLANGGEKIAPQSLVRRPYDTAGLERRPSEEKRPVGRPRKNVDAGEDIDSCTPRQKNKEELDAMEVEFAEREAKKMKMLEALSIKPDVDNSVKK